MRKETKVVSYSILAVLFGWAGYFVLRIDCISVFVIRPCDLVAAIIGVVFWGIALVMAIMAKKAGESPDSYGGKANPDGLSASPSEKKRNIAIAEKIKGISLVETPLLLQRLGRVSRWRL
jgi:hypothetical protein